MKSELTLSILEHLGLRDVYLDFFVENYMKNISISSLSRKEVKALIAENYSRISLDDLAAMATPRVFNIASIEVLGNLVVPVAGE